MAGRPALANNAFAQAAAAGIKVACETKLLIRSGRVSVVCLTHPTFVVPLHNLCDTDAPAEIARMHKENPEVFR